MDFTNNEFNTLVLGVLYQRLREKDSSLSNDQLMDKVDEVIGSHRLMQEVLKESVDLFFKDN